MNDQANHLARLLQKIQSRERMMETNLHDEWEQKKVKIAERLGIAIFICAILIYGVIQDELTGTHKLLTILAILVCGGSILWQQAIWRGLRRGATSKNGDELELLHLGLELASSCGYKLTLATTPNGNPLRVLLQAGGTEKPFMEVYRAKAPPRYSPRRTAWRISLECLC